MCSSFLAATIVSLAAASVAGAAEHPVSAANVPAAARSAVAARYPHAKVTRWTAEPDEKHRGATVYEAALTGTQGNVELVISSDGKVRSEERSVTPASLPEAIKSAAGGARILRADRVEEGGKVTYEIVVAEAGRETELTVSPEGKVLGKSAAEND